MSALVLTVAGSDPGGGAGLEQDLRVLAHFGLTGAAVATALTEQDSARVHAVDPLDADGVGRRLGRVLADLRPAAVKIGMLGTGAIAERVADVLEAGLDAATPIVLDPVLCSSSGAALLDASGVAVLRERLLPRVAWLTPNLVEARILSGDSAAFDGAALARELRSFGPAVYVTDGDDAGDVLTDDHEPILREYVAIGAEVETRRVARIPGPSPHGTGCALSAALAAGLALGAGEREALDGAVAFTRRAIAASRVIGRAEGARPRLIFEGGGR